MSRIDIKSILTFSAFRPEPDDPLAAWRRRFPGRRTIFFGFGRSTLSWRCVARNGAVDDLEIVRGDPKETLSQTSARLRELADSGWCAISLNTRYIISLETNLSRRPGSEDLVKTNPRGVLGGRYERGKQYALTHNPETNSSILFSCDDEQTRRVESVFRECGFRIGRICCGTYLLLRHALSLVNITKGSEQPVSMFFIVCCEGAVCALVQDQDRWLELRSRTDVYEEDLAPIGDLLAPFQARLAPQIGITLIADEPLPGFAESLSAVLPNRPINDLSQPGLLASLMLQN